jgi:hypothetical protein
MLLARGNARLMFFDELKLPFFKAFDSSDSYAQKATFSRHSFVAFSLPLLGFGSRARCRIAPFFKVSDSSDSAADNQRTIVRVSLFFRCFASVLSLLLPRVSVSSLFRLSRFSLVFRARNLKFSQVFKCLFLLVFFFSKVRF